MKMHLRTYLKENKAIRQAYFKFVALRNYIRSRANIFRLMVFHGREWRLLISMKSALKDFYPTRINLRNTEQYYCGVNILGYPALASVEKEGKNIGWAQSKLVKNHAELPLLQVVTDVELNFPLLFERYRPEYIVDCGTASGGTAVFFYDLVARYAPPHVLSIDISSHDMDAHAAFHEINESKQKIDFILDKSSLACLDEVQAFLKARPVGVKTLFSFDDNHTYEHTYAELNAYAPLLQPGDVILMQDTWDQGLYSHELSPLAAVFRFLAEHKEFSLDTELLHALTMPCNFIHGVIVRNE